MKNNKGFTLMELIAMLTVLAILMLITVPNMTGIINQQRDTAFIEDAEKLLSTAQMKLITEKSIKNPAKNNCIVMTMNFLDKGREMIKSADGGEYIRKENFVIIKRVGNTLEYTIRLVETNLNGEVYGIDMVEKSSMEKNGTNVLAFAEVENYNIDSATPESLSSKDHFRSNCVQIEAVYK